VTECCGTAHTGTKLVNQGMFGPVIYLHLAVNARNHFISYSGIGTLEFANQ